jgi:AcrR family transcriptional regulator
VATGSRTRNRTSKAEQAEATRGRIAAAATTLFLRDGFVTTTMAAIAREAGVAVQTLYLSFGSKTAILKAAFDVALAGHDEDHGILEADWFQRVLAEPDGPTACRMFCRHAGTVMGRAAPLFDVIRTAAADPEVAAIYTKNKRLRHEGFARIMTALASREGFASTMSADDALAIVYTVVSEETHLLMVVERGWTSERWQRWCADTCVTQLFPGAGMPADEPDVPLA